MNISTRIKSIIMALAITTSVAASVNVSAASESADIDTIPYSESYETASSSNDIWYNLYNFPSVKQSGKYDCWKACIQSVIYFRYGYMPTNYQFMEAGGQYYGATGQQPFYPVSDSNGDPNVMDIPLRTEALPFMVGFFHGFPLGGVYNSRLTNAQIKEQIDKQMPVIMTLNKNDGSIVGYHDVVLIGYAVSVTNPNQMTKIKIMDPTTGLTYTAPLTFSSGSDVTFTAISNSGETHTYTWCRSIVL